VISGWARRWAWAPLLLLGLGSAGCPRPARDGVPKTVPPVVSPGQKSAGKTVPPVEKRTESKFAALVGKARERRGFFDTYQKGEDLFLAVPKARLGEPFLLHCRIAQGIGMDPLSTGQSLTRGRELSLVTFERHGERLFLVQAPTRTVSRSESPFAAAVAQSSRGSILQAATIDAERPDGALVINIKGWVLGDLSDVSEAVGMLMRPTSGGSPRSIAPNKDRSFIESVKGFPDNVNVRAGLTFMPPELASPLPSVPDHRFVSVVVHYTFARLPAVPMAPRLDDDRIGFLAMSRQDLSSNTADFTVRYAHRWRLEPESPAPDGGLATPRRPIVFFIDPSIPAEFHKVVKEGVEIWQEAFTAAGWQQTVRAEPLPRGVDPDDLRYPTIRWDVGQNHVRGSAGLLSDPRSGEILGAGIRLSQNLIGNYRQTHLPLIGARLADGAHASSLASSPDGLDGLDDSELYEQLSVQGSLLRTSLIATGALAPSDPTPQRVLQQGIRKTVMHEVGHALGLAHNFKASSGVPNERLADAEWVRKNGLTVSIMDYPGINLPRGPAPADWYYYSPVLGKSDYLAIKWGYTRDQAEAAKLARTAAQSGHVLGLFDVAQLPSLVDPTDQTFDLGSDPLTWARERSAIVAELWRKLPERLLVDNVAYGELSEAFFTLMSEYMSGARIAARYLGGQYAVRDHVGDPDGKTPFSPVPKGRQREALDYILSGALADKTFAFPPELLTKLGTLPPGPNSRVRFLEDVHVLETIGHHQDRILGHLLDVDTFRRLRSSELKYGAAAVMTLPELFEQVSQGVWSELAIGAPRNVGPLRRELQRRHLERLGALLLSRGERGRTSDVHALSRHHLVELKRRLATQEKAGAPLDVYTRAHIVESLARIGKLLDAQLMD
jgi:hypothetical protein